MDKLLSTNPLYEFHVKYNGAVVDVVNLETGYYFAVAKDDMGVQICRSGNFYPDARDFGTVEKAVEFLNTGRNLELAEAFFQDPTQKTSLGESLYNVMTGIALHETRRSE
jgi:hypothetical protein